MVGQGRVARPKNKKKVSEKPSAFVYVLTAPDGRGRDYVKVGVTRDWRKRLSDLRHGLPFNVELMFVMGLHAMWFARMIEAELLMAFKKQSTRGEWFVFESGQRGHLLLLAEGAAHAHERGSSEFQWEPIDVSKPIAFYTPPPKQRRRFTARYRGGLAA